MKFTIGYGLENQDFDDHTLIMGEDGIRSQIDVRCPNIPEGFGVKRAVHTVDQNLQVATYEIEIDTIEQLAELSRQMGDLVIERQPQEMFETPGSTLPEFSIIVREP